MTTDEMTQAEIRAEIAEYEADYGMSSEQMLDMDRDGTLPDSFDFGAWKLLVSYLDEKG